MIETIDLTIVYELADDHRATFCTSALDVRPGEDLRIYYDDVCCFSGHVQQVTFVEAPFSSRPFLEVRADDLLSCKVPPIGWRCTRVRGHEGPCAAVPA